MGGWKLGKWTGKVSWDSSVLLLALAEAESGAFGLWSEPAQPSLCSYTSQIFKSLAQVFYFPPPSPPPSHNSDELFYHNDEAVLGILSLEHFCICCAIHTTSGKLSSHPNSSQAIH